MTQRSLESVFTLTVRDTGIVGVSSLSYTVLSVLFTLLAYSYVRERLMHPCDMSLYSRRVSIREFSVTHCPATLAFSSVQTHCNTPLSIGLTDWRYQWFEAYPDKGLSRQCSFWGLTRCFAPNPTGLGLPCSAMYPLTWDTLSDYSITATRQGDSLTRKL